MDVDHCPVLFKIDIYFTPKPSYNKNYPQNAPKTLFDMF